ncbi:MAG: metallophosphoesterase [Candidatus Hydrogenedentes bacterium]|nr:metallophosphoesterase [Candidatus Hydrogenedentota bacterium]
MIPVSLKRQFIILLGLLLCGLLLLLCILQAHLLWMPESLGVIGRPLYRAAFFIILPVRVIVTIFIPRADYHWPLANLVWSCMGTPFFLWGGTTFFRRFARTRRSRLAEDSATLPNLVDMSRRGLLARSMVGVAGVVVSGMGGYASFVAPERLRIRRYDLPIAQLPSVLDGLRIIHVSDTHYGPFTGLSYLEEVVQQVNRLRGDLVLLTGDYVHYTARAVESGIALLGNLESRFGAMAVLGNHDHWEGVERCRAAFARIGIPLLDNHRVFLDREGPVAKPEGGRTLCIAGVGDLWEDEVRIDQALGGVPEDTPRILLSHNPDVAETLRATNRVDLMLSGHTHGGQVYIPGFGALVVPSRYGDKYVGGLCRGPCCPVIVSRGVGLAGIPIRFCVPPEIGVITLYAS